MYVWMKDNPSMDGHPVKYCTVPDYLVFNSRKFSQGKIVIIPGKTSLARRFCCCDFREPLRRRYAAEHGTSEGTASKRKKCDCGKVNHMRQSTPADDIDHRSCRGTVEADRSRVGLAGSSALWSGRLYCSCQ